MLNEPFANLFNGFGKPVFSQVTFTGDPFINSKNDESESAALKLNFDGNDPGFFPTNILALGNASGVGDGEWFDLVGPVLEVSNRTNEVEKILDEVFLGDGVSGVQAFVQDESRVLLLIDSGDGAAYDKITLSGTFIQDYLTNNDLLIVNPPKEILPSEITLVIEKVGAVPLGFSSTIGFNNFQSPVAIDGDLYGIDAINGAIWKMENDGTGAPELVFNVITDLPPGLVLDDFNDGENDSMAEAIANMVGANGKAYIAFTADVLPNEVLRPDTFSIHTLPEFQQPGLVVDPTSPDGTKLVDDLYRLEADDLAGFPPFIPATFGIKYQVIYEYTLEDDGLSNPKLVTAFEVQASDTGHRGTGMEILDDGRILWATGDNLPFGLNGRTGAQLEDEIPSKLFIIDPETGSVELAANGLRNVQHLEIAEYQGVDYLAFANIGGVTSEEVNVIELDKILDTTEVENFGWGVAEDGLAREGTFYVGGEDNGIAGILGTQPPAKGTAPIGEEGFIQPHAEYSRTGTTPFVASSGPVISEESFGDVLSLVFGDLASGQLFGTVDPFSEIAADVFELNLVDTDGQETSLAELAGGRADPRFFTFDDGTAGVLIEATGDYFRLWESDIYFGDTLF